MLVEHPAVLEAAVVGAADDDELERPRAFCVLRDGYAPSAELGEQLAQWMHGRVAGHKVPRRVEFVAALPRTPTGKVQRFRLRAVRPPDSAGC
jgi:acyl-coenzyme A synthetase/AMP-(fatty) acid ligase